MMRVLLRVKLPLSCYCIQPWQGCNHIVLPLVEFLSRNGEIVSQRIHNPQFQVQFLVPPPVGMGMAFQAGKFAR